MEGSIAMAPFKLAVIVGSNRRDSINRKLAQALTKLGRDRFVANAVRIDDLPLYNQDLEADLPEAVARFKADVEAADAVLFVTPEHNRSIPAALKNAIDWGTRPWGANSWSGKVAAVAGASAGAVGTALAQQHLRQILGAQGVVLAGGEAYLTFKPGLIDGDDAVTDDSTRSFLKAYLDQFAALVARFAQPSRAAA
jgi:chromate reductase, NAD(P)H dehydrogenase (quinone)